MKENPAFKFGSSERERALQCLCQSVKQEFQLPWRSQLLIFIDSEFRRIPHLGPSDTAFHAPVRSTDKRGSPFPLIMQRQLQRENAADNGIYIRDSNHLNDPVAFVFILAHELQHSVQFGDNENLYRASCAWKEQPRTSPLMQWDIPIEVDAYRVGRRVTERVFSAAEFRAFLNKEMGEASEGKKALLSFLRELDLTRDYDWQRQAELSQVLIRAGGM